MYHGRDRKMMKVGKKKIGSKMVYKKTLIYRCEKKLIHISEHPTTMDHLIII